MNGKRYPEEFKIEAVRQVTERGHSVADVAKRLGITTRSLYKWRKHYGLGPARAAKVEDHRADAGFTHGGVIVSRMVGVDRPA